MRGGARGDRLVTITVPEDLVALILRGKQTTAEHRRAETTTGSPEWRCWHLVAAAVKLRRGT